MNQEKWEEIKFKIKKQFGIQNEGEEKQNDGKEIKWIEFNGAQGKMRLEYVKKPRFLDIKTTYSKRAGTSASSINTITSKDETVQFLKVYVFNDGEWVEADPLGGFGE